MSQQVPSRSHARAGHAVPRPTSLGIGASPVADGRRARRGATVVLGVALAVAATACGGGTDTPAASPAPSSSGSPAASALQVTASNYPLAWLTGQVGGEYVAVTNLTPPGAEPHELELTTDQLAGLRSTDLVITLTGFQPAVDEAVAQLPADRIVQPTAGVSLLAADDHGHEGEGEHVELAGGKDPHVWLDPRRFATMAGNVAAELSRRDPAHAAAYAANAATLTGELTALDTAWRTGTKTCANRTLVVSHEAFGYLADAYGFEQVGITGIAPDSEPNPRQLSSIAGTVRDRGVRTVYSETLVDPRIAQTVADEAGAQVKVLDPVEGIPAGSDDDYLSIMRRNLDTVRAGQPCP